ncbi:MAG: M24 family metallopeptidase [Candidatus Ranarchaeia archaeon]
MQNLPLLTEDIQSRIKKIRKKMNNQNIDSWIIVDHLGKDPMGKKLLGKYWPITRQYFIILTLDKISIIKSSIEGNDLLQFTSKDLEIHSYNSLNKLDRILLDYKKQNFQKIALNFDLENPEVDIIPAGRYNYLKKILGEKTTEFISARDFMQEIFSVLNSNQIKSHKKAARDCSSIMEQTIDLLQESFKNKREITENYVQHFIMDEFKKRKMVTSELPVVASGKNSSDPHYGGSNTIIPRNVPLLIDLWAKYEIYGDMTWMMYTGKNPPSDFEKTFNLVTKARDIGINSIEPNVEGNEIDKKVRNEFKKHNLDKYFIHRTGHSIDADVHGKGANLDSYEMVERRKLLPGSVVSVEPGVYFENKWGIRSEVDVLITPKGREVTTSIQNEIVTLL